MKYTAIAALLLMASCMPGKSDQKVDITVTCDSCFVHITNNTKVGETMYHETVYYGDVVGVKHLEAYRYSNGLNCLLVNSYISYFSDNVTIVFEQDGDIIWQQSQPQSTTAYCQ
jgi:hypothetical protein